MKVARWVVPLVSLLAVIAFTWWDLSRADAGPGPLHPAHAAVAELQGGANCAACHRDGSVSPQACVACHAAIGNQAVTQTGIHATLTESQCQMCHPEHHGDSAPLLPPHAFERLGVADPHAYDHRHVKFELTGVHIELSCVRCHEHADDRDPPAGGRFLGLSQQCTSCHQDVHVGAFGPDCRSCHGQEQAFSLAPGFTHARFELAGAHSKVSCAACHAEGTSRAVAAEEREALTVRTCAECHQNPHDGGAQVGAPLGSSGKPPASVANTALRFAKADDCARCHGSDVWKSARPTIAEHGELGFALRGVHAAADCASCHGDAQHAVRWRGEVPALQACAACHESPHAAELVRAATNAVAPKNGCAGCHGDADPSFAAGTISAEQHRATGFLLDAPHADLACSKCHAGAQRELRFPGRAATDCRSCHQDVHQGQFTHEGELQQCTVCHQADRFLPHRFGVAAHAASFALTGAHDAVACSACHKQVTNGVRQFVGTERACSQCHDDVHKRQFDLSGRPAVVDGRQGCARCHDTHSFRKVIA